MSLEWIFETKIIIYSEHILSGFQYMMETGYFIYENGCRMMNFS